MRVHDRKNNGVGRLYARPVVSRRSGPLYNAFSYPTKIDPEAVALFIASHTAPGDTVLDVFAGSGTTGLAANLCEVPTQRMRNQASQLGLTVEWGPRSVILYELSTIGALLSETMTNPPDPLAFELAARNLIGRVSSKLGWLYNAEDPDGGQGQIRHIIWTEFLRCPRCKTEASFWDLAVTKRPAHISKSGGCTTCGVSLKLDRIDRVVESIDDPVLDDTVIGRVRRPAFVYGRTGTRTWSRPVRSSDLRTLEKVATTPIPGTVPTRRVFRGDLYRAGYHQGLDRIHHFYTRRNLIVLGNLWNAIEKEKVELQRALRLLVLSYNASHSTLMTRIVTKKRQSAFVVTGAQSGVLYVSSLPVEKNIFEGLQRKLRVFARAFETSLGSQSVIRVVNSSSTTLDIPDRSIDYVFTDPPFGGYIPYAEVNQINEAWLGELTNRNEEVLVSPAQKKTTGDYAVLMKQVFCEVARVLRNDAPVTVVFHSSRPEVWSALGSALSLSGLSVVQGSLLDKVQPTFKQVLSPQTKNGNSLFLLTKTRPSPTRKSKTIDLDTLVKSSIAIRSKLDTQYLYTQYLMMCIEARAPVTLEYEAFRSRAEAVQTRLREVVIE